jgi:hypothetical protein
MSVENNNSEPLLYTSKGNLPVASLREAVVWTQNEDEIICAVEHWLDTECVRRQVNILKLRGENILGQSGVM